MNDRAIVVLPTYNEAENLPRMVSRIQAALPEIAILVVDDASPDGTGKIADRYASADPAFHVLHRPGKGGLGPAYIAGFARARELGYGIIVQSDADGSHRPEDLPTLLAGLESADVAVGSRWVAGGGLGGHWPWYRKRISRFGSRYAGRMLHLPQKDITGGFRAFTADALNAIQPAGVTSRGYCFQIEMLDRAARSGCRIVEVPITFDDRMHGTSKMSMGIVIEAFRRVTSWGVARLFRRPSPLPQISRNQAHA